MAGPLDWPAEYAVRAITATDAGQLGAVAYASYAQDGDSPWADLAASIADFDAAFAGDYGPLYEPGCRAVLDGDRVVAFALTVRRAIWTDTPDGPFITDLLTVPTHRRHGLGRALITHIAAAATADGESVVGLRVEVDNRAAQRLYRGLGFADWP